MGVANQPKENWTCLSAASMSFELVISTGSPQSPDSEIPTKPAAGSRSLFQMFNKAMLLHVYDRGLQIINLKMITILFASPLTIIGMPNLSMCLGTVVLKALLKQTNIPLPWHYLRIVMYVFSNLDDVMGSPVGPCAFQL